MPKTSTSSVSQEPPARSLDHYVGHWLRRAHQYTSATLTKHIRDHDLTPAQLATMLRLREVGHASQNELGRLVAMERANIHGIVNRLSGKGLVLAARDPSDARKTVIRLSDEGRRLVEELEPLHWTATQETLSVLSEGEAAQLVSLLKRVCRVAGSSC